MKSVLNTPIRALGVVLGIIILLFLWFFSSIPSLLGPTTNFSFALVIVFLILAVALMFSYSLITNKKIFTVLFRVLLITSILPLFIILGFTVSTFSNLFEGIHVDGVIFTLLGICSLFIIPLNLLVIARSHKNK